MKKTSLFELIGKEPGVEKLVDTFIAEVQNNPEAKSLLALYQSRENTFQHYRIRMIEFLTGWLGGPLLYTERHGMPMLKENHRFIPINAVVTQAWMACMRRALSKTIADKTVRLQLEDAFWHLCEHLRNQ